MRNEYFKWDKAFVLGIEEVDTQHLMLVEVVNEVLALTLEEKKLQDREWDAIRHKLSQYALDHFHSEEKFMENKALDEEYIRVHKQSHQDFIHHVNDFFESAIHNQDTLNHFSEYLVRWLAYHILHMDKSMVRQIEAIKSQKLSPQEAYEREKNYEQESSEPLLKALKALFYLVSEKNKELEKLVEERTAQLQEAYEKLKTMSLHDELTRIYNRRYALTQIKQLIEHWERYEVCFSILFIDVDAFKSVNDLHGHDIGDKVLIWIADFLTEHTRKTDIVCRLGGDEFLVICPHLAIDSAMQLGHKINSEVKKFLPEDYKKFWTPSLSIGVASISQNLSQTNELIKAADSAMYVGKKNGGGQCVKYQEGIL